MFYEIMGAQSVAEPEWTSGKAHLRAPHVPCLHSPGGASFALSARVEPFSLLSVPINRYLKGIALNLTQIFNISE